MLMSLKRPIAMFSPLALLGPVPPAARMICLWMSIFSRSSQKREITSTSNPSWARSVVWSEETRAGNEHSQCCTYSWLKAARYTTSNIKESTIRDYAKLDRYMILAKMSFQLQRLEAGCWWLWLVCPDCIVPGDLATVSTALLISSPGQQPRLWRPGLTSSHSVVTTRLGHCDQLETELWI